jgi:pimeloyl-ACP methyl ester carboxylesterase
MPTVAANGINLYYERHGDGEPLLFIMGLGGSHLAWLPLLPRFTDTYGCVVYDHRGTGESDAPAGPYSIEQFADDAAALIDALDLGAVNCVGLSMGGSVLQALCYRHPAKVKRAVLLSTLPAYTEVQHAWLDALLALRRAGADELAQSVIGLPWALTPRTLTDHSKVIAFARLGLQAPHPTSPECFALHGEAIRRYDSRPHLPEVKAPVLVLVGAEDVLTPVQQSVEMAQLISGARLQVLPRGGHVGIFEYADDYSAAILSFLAE